MDVADDLGLGEGEDVTVVEDVLVVILEAFATGGGFVEAVATNGCAHRSVKDEDAFGEGGLEFGGGVGLDHGDRRQGNFHID